MEGNTQKSCPAGMCAGLPVHRKVQVITGVLILLFIILSMVGVPMMGWMTIFLAGGLIYGGLTGNCLLTRMVEKHCCKEGSCDKGAGPSA